MSESTMRKKVVRALRPLNAVAVENPAMPGTPDVNYIEGWIELKRLPRWPVRQNTIVRIPTYTQQQRVWHFRRRRAGGQCWFLLQVLDEWLLIDGAVAALTINRSTRLELIRHTTGYWSNGLNQPDLLSVLANTTLAPYHFTKDELDRLRGMMNSE